MRRLTIISALLAIAAVSSAAMTVSIAQSRQGLDRRIPASVRSTYADIRDAKDWRNPKITIRAEGVEVASVSIPGGRRTVPANELREFLVTLPVTAWPYGCVVLASDIGIRRGDRSDDEPIRMNHEAAQQILDSLEVHVEWWPS